MRPIFRNDSQTFQPRLHVREETLSLSGVEIALEIHRVSSTSERKNTPREKLIYRAVRFVQGSQKPGLDLTLYHHQRPILSDTRDQGCLSMRRPEETVLAPSS